MTRPTSPLLDLRRTRSPACTTPRCPTPAPANALVSKLPVLLGGNASHKMTIYIIYILYEFGTGDALQTPPASKETKGRGREHLVSG
jgi:hypothetical protein